MKIDLDAQRNILCIHRDMGIGDADSLAFPMYLLDLDEQALREAKRMAENQVSGTRHPPEVTEMAWSLWLAKWFGE